MEGDEERMRREVTDGGEGDATLFLSVGAWISRGLLLLTHLRLGFTEREKCRRGAGKSSGQTERSELYI